MIPLIETFRNNGYPEDPLFERIQEAFDAGYDITEAVEILDTLEGDENLENFCDVDNEGFSEALYLEETCNLGCVHRLEHINIS